MNQLFSQGQAPLRTLGELADLLRNRKLSPVELTDFYLRRIEQSQPALNAFITITAEKAREEARRAEIEIAEGHYRGPLHGIPLSYKDLIATGGVATTAGSKVLAANIPTRDAAAVERLAAAGAIGLGKTNLHEFAFGITSNNEHFGPVRNPWNPEMIPGGSSGGSAVAVAAGLCAASIGSDTGGSIRIPASACGCVGLKPTYGRINLKGVIPLSWSMDHLGPIAQSAGDAAHLLDALVEPIQGHAAGDAPPLNGYAGAVLRIPADLSLGISSRWMEDGVHREVHRAVGSAIKILEERWGPARDIEFPYQEHLAMLGTVIAFAEAASYHEDWIQTRPEDYSHEVRTRLRLGKLYLATDYLRCQRIRRQLLQKASDLFRRIDILAYPTLPFVGAGIGDERVDVGGTEEDIRTASIRFNRPANLTGYPAISLPCGFSADGLPIGLQLMAAPFREDLLLQVAHFYESQTDWHTRRPASGE